MLDHAHDWERGAHMAAAFGIDGRRSACAICGEYKPAPAVPTSRSASHWLTPSFSGVGDYGAEQTRTPGHRLTAAGPRRPIAPTDLVPPGPVGAPSPERVP